ncbi:MAG: hypothetical protein ACOH1Y_02885 [Propionicimonas sp.]
MDPNLVDPGLHTLLDSFAARWLELSDPRVAAEIVADPILILGPAGTTPVPRAAFLAAIAGRAASVTAAVTSTTTLTGLTAQPLGDRMVLATITWRFEIGDTTASHAGPGPGVRLHCSPIRSRAA